MTRKAIRSVVMMAAAGTAVVGAAALRAPLGAQSSPATAFERLKAEGLDRSQVDPVFQMFTVGIGPRLTASPAQKRASEWARDRLTPPTTPTAPPP